MCDKNSNLNKAILAQVQTFATNNQSFSIHDTTVALRKTANAGNLNLPEFETPNSQFKYNIPHSSVKDAFSELLADGIFTEVNLQLNRNYNGVYFEYLAVPTVNGAVPATNASPTTATLQQVSNNAAVGTPPYSQKAPPPSRDKQAVTYRISSYLDNHAGQLITIEQIRAAIKCNGRTCSEIQVIVSALYPTSLTINNEHPSKGTVQL